MQQNKNQVFILYTANLVCYNFDLKYNSSGNRKTEKRVGKIKKTIKMDSELKNSQTLDAALSNVAQITNIQIIIDTDKIQNDFPGGGSKDSTKPTGIGHQYQYMVASNLTGSAGSGTADLVINALSGDVVRFNAVSEYDNFNNAVIIYNIQKFGGANVFSDFTSRVFSAPGVQPSAGASPLPIQTVNTMTYWFYQADVITSGTENYNISFALYTLDRPSGTMKLYGYFVWDPTIIVKG
ncbi:inclusion body family protein [Flavobacterium sp. ALJ2]|uniref:inclusion body family protein n=1 Tax=Flavobacterium sp. ALJ2 TaxID=2786960 RepID=UPI00189DF4C0|nr:inclusion body family protein [Flavobacterium sp. ALJ2]MBF7092097.1 inclusion body family protein [Flavobacterium sp. ALJ2]